jgi:hypothetical protein
MPEEIKPVLERQMEVYAGFLEHTDYHVGRLFPGMKRLSENSVVSIKNKSFAVTAEITEATQPMIFSADETTDIGEDFGMPVTADYPGDTSKFNGRIGLVQIDLGHDNHDHLIDPEEIIRIAFARQ